MSAAAPATPLRAAVVDVGDGRPADYAGVDVTGKVVLVRDNGDEFGLATEAEVRGAAAALLYLPDFWRPQTNSGQSQAGADEFPVGTTDDGRLESLMVLRIPGASTLQAHRGATVEIAGSDGTDLMADFSSRGPTASSPPNRTSSHPAWRSCRPCPAGGTGDPAAPAWPPRTWQARPRYWFSSTRTGHPRGSAPR